LKLVRSVLQVAAEIGVIDPFPDLLVVVERRTSVDNVKNVVSEWVTPLPQPSSCFFKSRLRRGGAPHGLWHLGPLARSPDDLGHVWHEVDAVLLPVQMNLYLFVMIFEIFDFETSSCLLSFFPSCFDVEVQASQGRMTQRMTQRKAKKSKELIRQQNLIIVFMA
jgi:hypothetical protein